MSVIPEIENYFKEIKEIIQSISKDQISKVV